MNDPKRQEIKNRIAASQARNAARGSGRGKTASDGEDSAGLLGFVSEHPIVTVAGGVALGVMIAGMFPSARTAARKGGARASALGVAGTQAALAAFEHFLDAAQEAGRAGSEKLEHLGDSLGETARSAGRQARDIADRSSDSARSAARDTSKTVSRSLNRFWR